jgi:hypothetical protein
MHINGATIENRSYPYIQISNTAVYPELVKEGTALISIYTCEKF